MDTIDHGEEFRRRINFYRRKEELSKLKSRWSVLDIQKNLASQADLEGRGKEGERQNKEREQAELGNGLRSFGNKIERSQEHSRHLAK